MRSLQSSLLWALSTSLLTLSLRAEWVCTVHRACQVLRGYPQQGYDMSGFGVQSADVDMSWQGVSYRRIPGDVSVGMWRLYVGFSALDGIVSFLRDMYSVILI